MENRHDTLPRIDDADRSGDARRNDRGAVLVEYAMLTALIAVVSIGALSTLGRATTETIERISGSVSTPIVIDLPAPDAPAPGPTPGPSPTPPTPPTTAPPTTAPPTTAPPTTAPPTTAPPTTAPPTTAPPTTAPPTTAPPESSTEWTGSSGTVMSSNHWRSEATVTVHGTDGKPLTDVSAGVHLTVVQIYLTWDGTQEERSWSDTVNVASDGTATITNHPLDFGKKNQEQVIGMRYEVTGVTYYWPQNPTIGWDGSTPSTTIIAPARP